MFQGGFHEFPTIFYKLHSQIDYIKCVQHIPAVHDAVEQEVEGEVCGLHHIGDVCDEEAGAAPASKRVDELEDL